MARRSRLLVPLLVIGLLVLGGGAASAAPLERTTELASGGPLDGGPDAGDVQGVRLSENGTGLYFLTAERLSTADTDAEDDVYVFSAGGSVLVSTSPLAGGSDSKDVSLREVTPDGSAAAFETEEPLTSDDGDVTGDVYVASGGALELASTGTDAGGGDSAGAFFQAFILNGALVAFTTSEAIETAFDPDANADVYVRSRGLAVTTLVSTGPFAGGGDSVNASFADASDDGSAIFFRTDESLNAFDLDAHTDLYRLQGGLITLMTQGTLGGGPGSAGIGNFVDAGAAPDGSNVIFFTNEQLNATDSDATRDVYRGSATDNPVLISDGPDEGGGDSSNADPTDPGAGGHDFFITAEPLITAVDGDTHDDIYERFAGVTTLVSDGPQAGGSDSADVDFGSRSSADGTRAFFETPEPLTSDDTDISGDVYERSGGVTTLVSGGPQAGGPDSEPASLGGVSADGSRVFFSTSEPLTADDTDADRDVYERSEGVMALVTTTAQAGGTDSLDSNFEGISLDGSRVAFSTTEPLLPVDADATEDAYLARPPEPVVIPDTTAPVIETLTVKPGAIRRGSSLPQLARRLRKKTTISFRLSEAATVKVSFKRAASGRRVRGRCRKPSRRNRGRRKCTRHVSVRGTISVTASSGDNKLLFSGRISRGRKLAAGRRYRLTLVATDTALNASKPRSARLRIARKRK